LVEKKQDYISKLMNHPQYSRLNLINPLISIKNVQTTGENSSVSSKLTLKEFQLMLNNLSIKLEQLNCEKKLLLLKRDIPHDVILAKIKLAELKDKLVKCVINLIAYFECQETFINIQLVLSVYFSTQITKIY
jgi:hypothetical protein